MGKNQKRSQSPQSDRENGTIQKTILSVSKDKNETDLINQLTFGDNIYISNTYPIKNTTLTNLQGKSANSNEVIVINDINLTGYDFENSEKEQKIVEIVKFYMNGSNFAKYVSIYDIFADPIYPRNSPSFDIQLIAMNYFNVQSIIKTQILSDTLFNLLNKQLILLLQNRTRKLLQFSQIDTKKLSADIFYQFDIIFYQEIISIFKSQKMKDQYKPHLKKKLNQNQENNEDIEEDEQTTDNGNDQNYDTHMKAGVGEVLEHWKDQVKIQHPELNIEQYLTKLENEKNPCVRRQNIKENQVINKKRQPHYIKKKNCIDSNEDSETNSIENKAKQNRLTYLFKRHLKKLKMAKLGIKTAKKTTIRKKPVYNRAMISQPTVEKHISFNENHKEFVIQQQEKLKEYQSLQNIFADGELERLSQENQLTKIYNTLQKDQNNTEENTNNQDQTVNFSFNSLFNQHPGTSQNILNQQYQNIPPHSDICRSIGKQITLNCLSKEDNDLEDEDRNKNSIETLPRHLYYDREKIKAFKIYFWRFVFETLSKDHLDQLELGQYEKNVILRIVNTMRDMSMNSNRNRYLKYSAYHSMLLFLTITKQNIPRLKESSKLSFLHEKIFGIADFNDERQILQINIFKRIMAEIALLQITQLTKKFTMFYGEELFKPNYIFTECQAVIYYLIKVKTMIMQYLQGIMRFGI